MNNATNTAAAAIETANFAIDHTPTDDQYILDCCKRAARLCEDAEIQCPTNIVRVVFASF